MNNQNAKADKGKPKLSLVPTEIINCIARCREYGTKKYHDPDNWKDVEKERYIDAAYRHWIKYVEDNNSIDEESRLPHLYHCCCNLAFLCEFDKVERETAKINDDISKLNDNEPRVDIKGEFDDTQNIMIYNAIAHGKSEDVYCIFKSTLNERIIYHDCCKENGESIMNCKDCPFYDFHSCECEIQKQIRRGKTK